MVCGEWNPLVPTLVTVSQEVATPLERKMDKPFSKYIIDYEDFYPSLGVCSRWLTTVKNDNRCMYDKRNMQIH